MGIELLAAALAGLIAGAIMGYALWARAAARAQKEAATTGTELAAARARAEGHAAAAARLATLEPERDRLAEDLAALRAGSAAREAALAEQAAALRTQFDGLAQAAIQQSQEHFRKLSQDALTQHRETADAGLKALLTPVAETLTRYEAGLKSMEATREQAYGGLRDQLAGVAEGQLRVQAEAGRLVTALRSSGKTSGSWGEQQLKNVLEMAGLREGIDFTLQTHVSTESGGRRPDAIVRLPGDRQLIIDSKCSLNDYLEAAGCEEAERRTALLRHAASVKTHARGLAEKAYWKDFGQSADFVVMFLPGENYLSAALEHDLSLLDWAFANRILLAGPINLLAIAKTVALVWRQEKLATEAQEIGKLGADLYAAVTAMAGHVEDAGDALGKAVAAHNRMVGSLERNVLPKARRFPELGVEKGKKDLVQLAPVAADPAPLNAPELKVTAKAA